MTQFWHEIYASVSKTAQSMHSINGVLSVFNSNIDAVVKVKPDRFYSWLQSQNINRITESNRTSINSFEDFIRGFLFCFERGIAQEWLIANQTTFEQIHQTVGYDKLQMGGQGGIIGNVMSAAGVNNVYVHAASLPSQQAEQFLPNENLLSADSAGNLIPAYKASRNEDIPLIHWIIEFDKGDSLTFNGKTFTCPKSNRFIATFDPLNFKLAIDEHFLQAINNCSTPIEFCLLSGYQMLTEPLSDGDSAQSRIDKSIEIVDQWKKNHPEMIVHFEFASTQDIAVRRMLIHSFGTYADSIGVNEQELIDLLEVVGETELAEQCREGSPEALLKALISLFEKVKTPRIQLHCFGLYATIQRKNFQFSPEANLRGMAFAATAAASKASSGSINTEESLLIAANLPVNQTASDLFLKAADFAQYYFGNDSLRSTGIVSTDQFDLIVLPTILIEKPVTLVGMGDTISSLSLTGSRVALNK